MRIQKYCLFLAVAFLNVAWLLPNHYHPWSTAYQDFAAFFSALLLVLSVTFFDDVRVSRGIVGFFLLPIIPFVQYSSGLILFSGDAWLAVFYLSGGALMLLVGYNWSLHRAARLIFVRVLAGAVVFGAILSSWIALRQWLLISNSGWEFGFNAGGRPYANFGQPNSLATLLCLGVVAVLYLYEKYNFSRITAAIISLFLLFGTALTQSRTSWIVAITLLVLFCWKAGRNKMRLSVGSALGWFFGYIFLICMLPSISQWFLLSSSDPTVRAQSLERLGIWQQFLYAVIEGPFWGYGWGQVGVAQISVSIDRPLAMMAYHSHNIILDLLLWNGWLLGGVIVISAALWFFRLSYRVCSTEGIFALFSAVVILIHGMLEFPLEYAFFLFPFGFFLGIAAAERRSSGDILVPLYLLRCLLVVGLGFCIFIWREYSIIEEDYKVMRFENAHIANLDKEPVAPNIILLTQLREYIRFNRTPAVENMTSSELDWMRKVTLRNPFPWCLFRYALALSLNDQASAAREQLLILRNLHGEKLYEMAMQNFREQHPELLKVLH